ncbi:drug resistance transporter, EmrB/QacA subfamily [Oscillochloris trichoides DG-6]|uniref:Drug resistance transporter, EmrB/QacA subfamily n=1 Tax=Oscillochloris trichoides DG-6 TaxID=765420 RepID=E1IBM6_9CHLR|nr:MFS transporter [Oscillochloris trichoides]EFO81445.1 drug resistance transporter, EmrB/QacA subfamily [Oscillochloris trichoides DG-6]
MVDDTRKWWALTAIGSGVLLSTIDGSIVNIALNTLVTAFETNLNSAEWVVLAYLLTLTCLLLLMGRLGDMFGKRRVYVAGFVIFTLASALCGLAPNIALLIAFRVIQAIGAAMIQAVGPALLVTAFPPNQRGLAMGSVGSFVALGILLGPALGGLLLRYVGWESIFYVNVPVGIVGTWLALRYIAPDTQTKPGQVFDVAGALLLMASIFGLLLALTEGPIWGWGDGRILALLALCVLAGVAFVFWENRVSQPMINLRIFRTPAFSLNLLAGFILFIGMSFNLLLTPLFLQLVYQLELQQTGFFLMAMPLTLSLVSPLSGRLSDQVGSRALTVSGLITIALGLWGISFTGVETPMLQLIGFLMLMGVGIGLFQSPNNSTVMGHAPPEALGVAGGLLAVMRTLGQTAGIAVAGAVWASQVLAIGGPIEPITAASPQVLAEAFAVAMRIAAGVALLAVLPSLVGGRKG